MTTWQHGREARDARIEAGAKLAKGKIVEARDATSAAGSRHRPGDRVCLEGDNQKQADLLARALRRGRSRQGARPAHGAVRASCCPSISTCSSAASRSGSTSPIPARSRRASRACCSAARSSSARSTPISSCSPATSSTSRRNVALIARSQRGSRRQSLHRPEHRGHADRRRGDRLQGRHRHRPGQRDRRQGAARRHPGRPGALRRQGGQAVLRRAAVHARPGRRSPRSRS